MQSKKALSRSKESAQRKQPSPRKIRQGDPQSEWVINHYLFQKTPQQTPTRDDQYHPFPLITQRPPKVSPLSPPRRRLINRLVPRLILRFTKLFLYLLSSTLLLAQTFRSPRSISSLFLGDTVGFLVLELSETLLFFFFLLGWRRFWFGLALWGSCGCLDGCLMKISVFVCLFFLFKREVDIRLDIASNVGGCGFTLSAFPSFCPSTRRVACFPGFTDDWSCTSSCFVDDMVDPFHHALSSVS